MFGPGPLVVSADDRETVRNRYRCRRAVPICLGRGAMKKALHFTIFFGLALAAGMLAGSSLAKSSMFPPISKQEARTLLMVLPFLLWMVIAVHECGHLLGGKLIGFGFQMLAVGPLMVVREAGRVRVKWNRVLSLWGGVASALPMKLEDVTRGMLVFTAGGPLASLMFAVLLWPLEHPIARVASLFSAAITCVTLIPTRFSGFLSDGGRMWMFLREPAKAKRWSSLAALAAYSQSKLRPREWPAELLEQARAIADKSPDDLAAAWLAHKAWLDRGEVDQAAAAIAYVRANAESLPKVSRDLLTLDLAVFHGLFGCAAVEAPKDKPLFAADSDFELARAVSLLNRGDHTEASHLAQRALEQLAEPASGGGLLTRDLLQEVVRRGNA